MADNSDTPKILEEISRAGAKGKGRPRNQKNARRRLFAVALLLVPILITTCYLGFQFYELRKEFATLNSRYGALSSNVSDQNSQFQALATEVDKFSSAEIPAQSLIENVRMMNSEIEALKARELDRPSEPESYWHIREAEFLLNLANRKLTLEKDINSSIALIEHADSSIVASGDRNVIPLRESLSRALVNLRAFVQVDKEGIFIHQWVPELAELPAPHCFQPWLAPKEVLQKANVLLGDNYPNPIIDLSASRDRALSAYAHLKTKKS